MRYLIFLAVPSAVVAFALGTVLGLVRIVLGVTCLAFKEGYCYIVDKVID